MNEKICRLCLETIRNNNCRAIGETLVKTLKLNLKITEETVVCIECANWFQVLSNFTSCFVNTGDMTLPLSDPENGVKLDTETIEATSNLELLIKTEIKCSFCTKTYGREDLVLLNESKDHKFLVNMLEEYILETDLKNTEALLTCGTCFEALQGVSSFILKCSEVEEKISKYIELEGTDDKGQIELKDVQQFMFKPILKLETEWVDVNELEKRCDQVKEEYTTMAEGEMKHEQEINNAELIVKTEDAYIKSEPIDCDITDIKSEQSDCNGFQEIPNDPLRTSVVTSEKRKCKDHIKQHLLNPGLLVKKTFKCEMCPYGAKQKYALKLHVLTHKSPLEIKMIKCESCSYEAKHKSALKSHLLTHKSPSQIKMFQCDLCSYEAKRKFVLKTHLLTHKSPAEIKMFKCDWCPYQAKRKHVLKSHLLIHKSPSEIKMFKCELCPYAAKRKSALKSHLLTHKSPSEIKMCKCEKCSFETKFKHNLAQHLLTHKNPSEIQMFNCELCLYETKYKSALEDHLLTHKNSLETKVFKCELCSYKAKRKCHLKRHLLIHKNPSEIKMFKCELCPYEAIQKYSLKLHELTHKSPSEIKMFKCDLCSYEAKRKSALESHLLTHKSPSEIETFKCDMCPYEGKRKSTLKNHLMTHNAILL